MNICGINFESVADGDGVRTVVYCSGCLHNCKGCHNPDARDFNAGVAFTGELQRQIIDYVGRTPFIAGITLSGGDPMFSASELIGFVEKLKSESPSSSVWIYSGFTLEEIKESPAMRRLLLLCDVLVDGKFILEQKDSTLPYRGSKNQRIIRIKNERKLKV